MTLKESVYFQQILLKNQTCNITYIVIKKLKFLTLILENYQNYKNINEKKMIFKLHSSCKAF